MSLNMSRNSYQRGFFSVDLAACVVFFAWDPPQSKKNIYNVTMTGLWPSSTWLVLLKLTAEACNLLKHRRTHLHIRPRTPSTYAPTLRAGVTRNYSHTFNLDLNLESIWTRTAIWTALFMCVVKMGTWFMCVSSTHDDSIIMGAAFFD